MARIKLDLDRRLGRLDRRVFGQFIEHLGRCIYGGIFDEGSPLSDERGFRTDVLAAAKALRPPVLLASRVRTASASSRAASSTGSPVGGTGSVVVAGEAQALLEVGVQPLHVAPGRVEVAVLAGVLPVPADGSEDPIEVDQGHRLLGLGLHRTPPWSSGNSHVG